MTSIQLNPQVTPITRKTFPQCSEFHQAKKWVNQVAPHYSNDRTAKDSLQPNLQSCPWARGHFQVFRSRYKLPFGIVWRTKPGSMRDGRELLQLWGSNGQADKQSTCSDVNKKNTKLNKTGLKWHHLKHLHVSKEVSLKCLHTEAHSMGLNTRN